MTRTFQNLPEPSSPFLGYRSEVHEMHHKEKKQPWATYLISCCTSSASPEPDPHAGMGGGGFQPWQATTKT